MPHIWQISEIRIFLDRQLDGTPGPSLPSEIWSRFPNTRVAHPLRLAFQVSPNLRRLVQLARCKRSRWPAGASFPQTARGSDTPRLPAAPTCIQTKLCAVGQSSASPCSACLENFVASFLLKLTGEGEASNYPLANLDRRQQQWEVGKGLKHSTQCVHVRCPREIMGLRQVALISPHVL